jgi:hypothetical protein
MQETQVLTSYNKIKISSGCFICVSVVWILQLLCTKVLSSQIYFSATIPKTRDSPQADTFLTPLRLLYPLVEDMGWQGERIPWDAVWDITSISHNST